VPCGVGAPGGCSSLPAERGGFFFFFSGPRQDPGPLGLPSADPNRIVGISRSLALAGTVAAGPTPAARRHQRRPANLSISASAAGCPFCHCFCLSRLLPPNQAPPGPAMAGFSAGSSTRSAEPGASHLRCHSAAAPARPHLPSISARRRRSRKPSVPANPSRRGSSAGALLALPPGLRSLAYQRGPGGPGLGPQDRASSGPRPPPNRSVRARAAPRPPPQQPATLWCSFPFAVYQGGRGS